MRDSMFTPAQGFMSNWYRDRFKTSRAMSDLSQRGEAEVARTALARDLGMTVSEFRGIDLRGPNAADLLLRRMSTLDLDSQEVAHRDPAVARDLQRVCTLC